MKREDLFRHVKDTLVKEFECNESSIVPEARFYEDLDLDSIDAVDLIVRLRKEVKFDINSEEFTAIRTVGDLVALLERLASAPAAG